MYNVKSTVTHRCGRVVLFRKSADCGISKVMRNFHIIVMYLPLHSVISIYAFLLYRSHSKANTVNQTILRCVFKRKTYKLQCLKMKSDIP